MGVISALLDNIPDLCQDYLAGFGLVFSLYVGFRCLKELWVIVNQFLLGKLMGPAVDLRKMGEWAVVTGATDGIGLAYAHELAQMGIKLILISRSQEKLDKVANAIEKQHGVQTKTVVFDFTQSYEKYDVIKRALNNLEVGILVNNVGMAAGQPLRLTEYPDSEKKMNDIITCNIVSASMMTHIAIPGMISRRKGVVITIASFSGFYPVPFLSTYPASKAYADFFSRCMSQEYAKHGILFQSVMPHFVVTKMLEDKLKQNLFFPSPDTYVKSALRTLGRSNRTFGYFPHYIQACIARALGEPGYFSLTLSSLFDKFRHEELEKLGITPQD